MEQDSPNAKSLRILISNDDGVYAQEFMRLQMN